MFTSRKRKYLMVIAIITSLYGVVTTTSATNTYDLYSKNHANQQKINKSEYTSSKDWGDDVTIQLSSNTESQLVDKSVIGIVQHVASTLNVRSSAEFNNNVVGKLALTAKVKVLDSKDGWDRIEFKDCEQGYGYVSGVFLAKETKNATSKQNVADSTATKEVYGRLDVFENVEE